MGFEVLDSQDWVGSGLLDRDLDERLPAAGGIVQLDEPTVNEKARGRRSAGRGAAMLIVSLTMGTVAGGFLVGRHQEDRQRQAAEAAFTASATINAFSASGGTGWTAVNLTTTVTNHGLRPIAVVTTPQGGAFGTRVSVVGGVPEIAPGESSQVRMHLHVDCDQPDELTSDLRVRTADRREHRLTLGPNVGAMTLQAACRSSLGNSLRPRA